ncbi:MAG: phosphatase PAP2 family protein [Acidimicrobiales bacterium]
MSDRSAADGPRPSVRPIAVVLRAGQVIVGWGVLLGITFVGAYLLIGPSGHGPAAGFDGDIARAIARHRPPGAAGVSPLLPVVVCTLAGLGAAILVLRSLRASRGSDRSTAWPDAIRAAIALALAAAGSYALSDTLKAIFARHRPPHGLATTTDTGFSFPSSHSTVGLAIIVVCALVARRYVDRRWHRTITVAAVVAGLLIPLSRLAMGVHWTTDVAIGGLIGAIWGIFVWHQVMRYLPGSMVQTRRRKQVVGAGAIALILLAAGPAWSYGRALRSPGSADAGTRTTDWLRSEGASGMVNWFENFWYARQPSLVAARTPHHPFGAGAINPTVAAGPAPIHLTVRAAGADLVGSAFNGAWVPVVQPGSPPDLYTAFWHPDQSQPNTVVAGMWMDHSRVRPQLVAGTKEPGGKHWPWGAQIPSAQRKHVVAAFNGGFRMADAHGGFMENGRVGKPLQSGAASLVIFRDGSATIGRWNVDVHNNSAVVAVRQNLRPIVLSGAPVPGLATNPFGGWGSHHSQFQSTWRSALGIDRSGNLVYVAGDHLQLQTLAEALVQAGAVTGMELDIHTPVVTCNLYEVDPANPAKVIARKLLPDMHRPATRYLQPDQRDFIAIVAR